MVALYLDDNLADKRMARQLRAAGHLIYLPVEIGTNGADDSVHLQNAVELGAVLATKDIADFEELHAQWQETSREHAGIIVCRELPIGQRLAYLGRAARLLTPEAARNQLMVLKLFRTDALAQAYLTSLSPIDS